MRRAVNITVTALISIAFVLLGVFVFFVLSSVRGNVRGFRKIYRDLLLRDIRHGPQYRAERERAVKVRGKHDKAAG